MNPYDKAVMDAFHDELQKLGCYELEKTAWISGLAQKARFLKSAIPKYMMGSRVANLQRFFQTGKLGVTGKMGAILRFPQHAYRAYPAGAFASQAQKAAKTGMEFFNRAKTPLSAGAAAVGGFAAGKIPFKQAFGNLKGAAGSLWGMAGKSGATRVVYKNGKRTIVKNPSLLDFADQAAKAKRKFEYILDPSKRPIAKFGRGAKTVAGGLGIGTAIGGGALLYGGLTQNPATSGSSIERGRQILGWE